MFPSGQLEQLHAWVGGFLHPQQPRNLGKLRVTTDVDPFLARRVAF
jgi:hypothetical protein